MAGLIKRLFNVGKLRFAAWLDKSGNAAFVVDDTRDQISPDVRLIINPDPMDDLKKWDSILRDDFKIDPEIVRPRVDNKYQKLDIDYAGLSLYQKLIDAENAGAKAARSDIIAVENFRINAAAIAAQKRIDDANDLLEKVSDTVGISDKTAIKIKGDLRVLKEKLSAVRATVGKQPTKAAAAKILKIQSQMEALTEKSGRNDLRKKRTLKKIAAANREIEEMTARLEFLKQMGAEVNDVVAAEYEDDNAHSSVQPLVAKNPNIVDESKAFKSVYSKDDANDDVVDEYVEDAAEAKVEDIAAPVKEQVEIPTSTRPAQVEREKPKQIFQAPVMGTLWNQVSDDADSNPLSSQNVVLNSVPVAQEPVEQEDDSIEAELRYFNAENSSEGKEVERMVENNYEMNQEQMIPASAGMTGSSNVENSGVVSGAAAIGAQPVVRPIGLGGNAGTFNSMSNNKAEKRPGEPSSGYYILLLILIILSVATLYIYQKKLDKNVLPHLEPVITQNNSVGAGEGAKNADAKSDVAPKGAAVGAVVGGVGLGAGIGAVPQEELTGIAAAAFQKPMVLPAKIPDEMPAGFQVTGEEVKAEDSAVSQADDENDASKTSDNNADVATDNVAEIQENSDDVFLDDDDINYAEESAEIIAEPAPDEKPQLEGLLNDAANAPEVVEEVATNGVATEGAIAETEIVAEVVADEIKSDAESTGIVETPVVVDSSLPTGAIDANVAIEADKQAAEMVAGVDMQAKIAEVAAQRAAEAEKVDAAVESAPVEDVAVATETQVVEETASEPVAESDASAEPVVAVEEPKDCLRKNADGSCQNVFGAPEEVAEIATGSVAVDDSAVADGESGAEPVNADAEVIEETAVASNDIAVDDSGAVVGSDVVEPVAVAEEVVEEEAPVVETGAESDDAAIDSNAPVDSTVDGGADMYSEPTDSDAVVENIAE
jgi:hypothetical protein